MKKAVLSSALLAIATLSTASIASAGAKYYAAVVVNPSASVAAGYVGDTHNSANTTEMIYCETRGYSTYAHGYCFARTAAKVDAQCNTMSEHVVKAIQSIGSDSAIRFRWDAWGNCTSVIVTNGSMYNTKQP